MKTKDNHESQYPRSLIEASPDPLFTISPEGKITDVNNASINLTDVTREKLIGTNFIKYFTDQDKARDMYMQVFAKSFVFDYPLTIHDGKLTDVLFNGSVYKDENDKVLGAIVVARDITNKKRIEAELIEAKENAELTTEIAEKAKIKAENATKIAEEAVRSKQRFLSNMSHEIRTPMNAIIGFTKVLLKTVITTKQKEYLTAIKTSGDALTILINDILDLAKVEAGKMHYEQVPFKMAASITVMTYLFETKIQERNLKLITKYDSKIPQILIGDPIRLQQIVLNLLSNAVKFTTEGSITVGVKLLNEDQEKVTLEFSITDTGIGIEENKIEQIFDNFQQATGETSRLYGGTGLGLAIAKQLVETQGGAMSVLSKPGVGSTFSFSLPFQKTKTEVVLEIETKELNIEVKNIRVLVVEDIPLNQLLMETLLDDFGFLHEIASNGKIAIEKLQNKHYDIILMDLQMPEMNGFEATEHIRKIMKSNIPIIALTADVTTTDIKKCKAIGMNDYVSKPIDEKLLYSKIIRYIKKTNPLQETFIEENENQPQMIGGSSRCIDLTYLNKRAKANPELIMELIALYLEQTPLLISKMKQSAVDNDWDLLYAAVHKIIPSFYIMGIHKDYEDKAQKIQEYTSTQQHLDKVQELVVQIENICNQACIELKEEYYILKKATDEK